MRIPEGQSAPQYVMKLAWKAFPYLHRMVFRKGQAKKAELLCELREVGSVIDEFRNNVDRELKDTNIDIVAKREVEDARDRGETLILSDFIYNLLTKGPVPVSRMPKSMVLPDKTITAVRSCIATYLSRTKFMAKRILDYMYGPPKHPKRTPKRKRLWEAADIMATFNFWRVNDES